ncbi:hypothetical protein [Limosilactobacillus vaginalis]|uniref:Uncharacterized protein n=1 Tax=Limosilactobacillus vaginalis DSM 5837 = ATCC 49540 TaxID=1423814 RepID=C2EWD5_9LACO|nr:hypothetical protein [Limosilactobacillus vaginalis]EEJ39771.1 hypothetical protein HMPREF0549_1771 [Limosilactobacillus vaginalis DSM 5837 = ATCC 49540]KRM49066.1 hypothetical protein FC58_GL000798 [Limosilactobacillus vaginalis DSM 5837 = ATCC 49540]QFS34343.1 hypothetical protein LV515_05380 [Limosilactobacillus vaginalis]
MNCITDNLRAAMDSLSARYNDSGISEWGSSKEKIDDVLSPNDWRMKEIIKFRERIESSDVSRKQRAINKIRSELKRLNITDDEAKIRKLYESGLGNNRIKAITGIPLTRIDQQINEYRRAHSGYMKTKNFTTYVDALVLLRSGMDVKPTSRAFKNSYR